MCLKLLVDQVLQQRGAFQEVLDQANLFTGIKTLQQGIAMRRSAMQLNNLAVRLGKAMEDVMPIVDRVSLASLLVEVQLNLVKTLCTTVPITGLA